MSNSGKGSAQRPKEVDQKTFEKNWDQIFKVRCPECKSLDYEEKHGWYCNMEVYYKQCRVCGEQFDHG